MQISNAEDKDDPLNLVPLDEGGIDPQSFSAHTLLASTTAPRSYLQAHEVGATQEELANMEKYKAWEVVPRLSNMRVMVARWVYCETGKPSACKARSVPKGFSQIEGIDFNELFAFNHLQSRMRHQSCFSTMILSQQSTLRHQKAAIFRERQLTRCFNIAFDEWLLQSRSCSNSGRSLHLHQATRQHIPHAVCACGRSNHRLYQPICT